MLRMLIVGVGRWRFMLLLDRRVLWGCRVGKLMDGLLEIIHWFVLSVWCLRLV